MMSVQKIEQRNKWLFRLFNTIFPGKITLANTIDNPAVIYDNSICLSCFVSNYELNFMSMPRDGKKIYSVLLGEKVAIDTEQVVRWFTLAVHRSIYTIILSETNPLLMLSGYNYINKEQKIGKYPVFSHHNPKIYMNADNAEKVCEELRPDGYALVVKRGLSNGIKTC